MIHPFNQKRKAHSLELVTQKPRDSRDGVTGTDVMFPEFFFPPTIAHEYLHQFDKWNRTLNLEKNEGYC